VYLIETELVGTPAPVADLEVTATVSAPTIIARGQLTYTLTVTNHGAVPATGVKLTDVFEAGAVYVSATLSQGSGDGDGDTFIADLGTLQPEQSAVISLVIEPREPGALRNTVAVRAVEHDPVLSDNLRVLTTQVVAAPPANLVLSTTDTPSSILLGGNLTYKLRVTNAGPNPATGVLLEQDLPGGVELISTHTTQGVVVVDGEALTASLGNLPSGAVVTVTVVVRPLNFAYYNSSISVSGNEPDPNEANNFAHLVILADNPPRPDLTGHWGLLKFQSKGTGESLQYRISGWLGILNQGNADSSTRFVTRIYVSTDGVLSEDDRLVKTFTSSRIRRGRNTRHKLNVKLPRGVDASESYVIAVIDAEDAVSESDETNNREVGPGRFPMAPAR
jgi:uncharacterized repeat protein (TIGR01451 family)